jgi:Mlc titration factor MtfA (ptsG expression regulator)
MPQITPRKAKKNQIFAFFLSFLIFSLFLVIIYNSAANNLSRLLILAGIGLLIAYSIFNTLTAKYRKRNTILLTQFPETWRKTLINNVAFYNTLSKTNKIRFEQNIQIFLAEKRITGIQTKIDDKIKLLVASSAIIPIFGFKEWEYDNLGEVLIYPNTFSQDFQTEGEGRNVLGMVGEGVMKGMMILSKKALLDGFQNEKDGQNTAIHEFVHLIDSKDGDFDGIPHLLEKQYVIPWLDLMYKEIEKINAGNSSIRPYGATSEVEFLAVASEYFFEKPKVMEKRYPELYEMLVQIFHQDLTNQFTYQIRDLVGITGKKINRNAPCPCGSSKKYKKCCL